MCVFVFFKAVLVLITCATERNDAIILRSGHVTAAEAVERSLLLTAWILTR